MNWQPIETAPKDGTEVFLYFPGGGRKIWSGYWKHSQHYSNGKLEYDRAYWVTGMMSVGKDLEPTHWMTAPEPPPHAQERIDKLPRF